MFNNKCIFDLIQVHHSETADRKGFDILRCGSKPGIRDGRDEMARQRRGTCETYHPSVGRKHYSYDFQSKRRQAWIYSYDAKRILRQEHNVFPVEGKKNSYQLIDSFKAFKLKIIKSGMPDNATLRQGLAMWVQYHMVPKFLKLHQNLFFLNYVNWQDGCYRHVPDKQRPTACTQLCLVSFQ